MSLLPIPTSIGKDISGSIASALLKAVLGWEASLVKSLVTDVIGATTAVTPGEGNGWFAGEAHAMFRVEVMVMPPLLFAATIGAIFHQDMRRLARAWGAGLPLSMIGGFAVVNLSLLGLDVTDKMSGFIEAQVAPNFGLDFAKALSLDAATGPVGALFGIVVLAGGVAIWLELILRASAVELAIFFMPLAFAGLVWPATAHIAKRLLQVLVALLLAKPMVVAALCLGDYALTHAQAGASAVVTGAAILLMAGFAPMVLLKLVPLVEVAAIAHLQGVARQPLQVAERSVLRAVSLTGGVASTGAGASSLGTPPAEGGAHLLAQLDREGTSGGRASPPQDDAGLGPARYPAAAAPTASPAATLTAGPGA
ncbi:MAG TPA: hypothetical protein VK425_05200 [Acidimicrobiales bacterium]|nr:hypothetical protein [Acidimicrobiales bacterium]